jgi:hypothetical protein
VARAWLGCLALDVLQLILFAVLGAATGLLLDVLFRLPKNDFGICTGSGPVDPPTPMSRPRTTQASHP